MSYLLLKIFQNSQLLKTKIFTDDQISIGQSEGLSLHLPELSPWHLLIEKKHNVFSILDLGSETGTFINGAQITEESLLKSGDIIKAGPYEMHFFIGSQQVQTHAGQALPPQPKPVSPPQPPQPEQTYAGPAPTQPPQSGQTYVGSVPSQPPQPEQTYVGPAPTQPPQSGQTYVGSVPSQSPQPEQTYVGPAPTQPPQSGQTYVGSVPSQSPQPEQTYVSPAPTQPPQSGQTYAGSVPSQSPQPEQTYAGSVPSQPPQLEQTYVGEKLVQTPQSDLSSKELSENFEYSDGYYKVPKPKGKGFWNTYAPTGKIKNLEDIMEPSIGNLIEVNIVWKDRVLKTHTFSKGGDIYMGFDKNCQIKFPPMVQQEPYKLISISSGATVYLQGAVKGVLFQGKKRETRTTHQLNGNQNIVLKPYEMLKLEFGNELRVYIRLTDKPEKLPFADLLNLRLSESMALLFAFLLTGLLFFYGTLYAPAFLAKDIDFIEKDIRVAQVVFKKRPEKRKVVKYDLTEKTKRASIVKKAKKKKPKKRLSLKSPIKKRVKKISTPKKGKQGKMAAAAPGKTKAKTKVKVGSSRPGGSLKTGKKGSSAKTKAPDPSKVGLLGAFGSGGKLAKLDKGASGPGGLTGLANQYTGFGGTKESYEGEGVGTKTKELTSGGQGEALVGASGIKTGGKGLGLVGSGRGGFGKRGRLSMEFSTEDIDVTGEIDREAIARVIRRNRAKFDRCYNQSLNDSPSLQGRLKMEWRIAGSGRGTRARALSGGIDSKVLKRCVGGVLESLIFPTPPSGQIPEVSFTFNFST